MRDGEEAERGRRQSRGRRLALGPLVELGVSGRRAERASTPAELEGDQDVQDDGAGGSEDVEGGVGGEGGGGVPAVEAQRREVRHADQQQEQEGREPAAGYEQERAGFRQQVGVAQRPADGQVAVERHAGEAEAVHGAESPLEQLDVAGRGVPEGRLGHLQEHREVDQRQGRQQEDADDQTDDQVSRFLALLGHLALEGDAEGKDAAEQGHAARQKVRLQGDAQLVLTGHVRVLGEVQRHLTSHDHVPGEVQGHPPFVRRGHRALVGQQHHRVL